jgi:hypothetical protein
MLLAARALPLPLAASTVADAATRRLLHDAYVAGYVRIS